MADIALLYIAWNDNFPQFPPLNQSLPLFTHPSISLQGSPTSNSQVSFVAGFDLCVLCIYNLLQISGLFYFGFYILITNKLTHTDTFTQMENRQVQQGQRNSVLSPQKSTTKYIIRMKQHGRYEG